MELVKKTYSKLREDFLLNRFTNFAIAISIGHVSHTTLDEWLSKCLSNFSLDSKIRSHFSQ